MAEVVGDLAGIQTGCIELCGDEVPERVRVQPFPRRACDDLTELLSRVVRIPKSGPLSGLNGRRANPLERACSLSGGGLNADEWGRAVQGQPYEDSCSR
jgi:hypothetical protein